MNALFVCTANRLRSPTAEQVFASWPGIATDSAGLADYAVTVLSLAIRSSGRTAFSSWSGAISID